MPPRAADPDFTKSRRETAEDDAAARPLTIRSWPEALNAGGFSSACMMASSCDGCPCVFPGWPRLLVAVSFSFSCILQIWWLSPCLHVRRYYTLANGGPGRENNQKMGQRL